MNEGAHIIYMGLIKSRVNKHSVYQNRIGQVAVWWIGKIIKVLTSVVSLFQLTILLSKNDIQYDSVLEA